MARHCHHRLAMPIWLVVLHSSIEPNHVTGAHGFLMRYHHLGGFDKPTSETDCILVAYVPGGYARRWN